MTTTTRFETMTPGDSKKTMTVHAVIDTANDKAAFYITRTPLEQKRNCDFFPAVLR